MQTNLRIALWKSTGEFGRFGLREEKVVFFFGGGGGGRKEGGGCVFGWWWFGLCFLFFSVELVALRGYGDGRVGLVMDGK